MADIDITERIDREVLVPTSVDELWQVITADGWLADEVRFDLVPGGEASFVEADTARTGWVEKADPPADGEGSGHLVFWWARDGEPASRVELTLEPRESGYTQLRIAETRPLEVLDLVGIPLPGTGGSAHGPAMLMAA